MPHSFRLIEVRALELLLGFLIKSAKAEAPLSPIKVFPSRDRAMRPCMAGVPGRGTTINPDSSPSTSSDMSLGLE